MAESATGVVGNAVVFKEDSRDDDGKSGVVSKVVVSTSGANSENCAQY